MPDYTIRKIISDFENGQILIPTFQREFVWSDSQIVTLAESIYKGYPFGIIILYEWIEDGKKQHMVLDGQQRLLSMVLMKNESIKTATGERRLAIWFNVMTEEFKESPYSPGSDWVRLKDIITKSTAEDATEAILKISRRYGEKSNEVFIKLWRLWSQFNDDYKVPIFILPENTDLDTLGEIFVRINFAGTRVRSADINYTMLAIVSEDVARRMREFSHELANAKTLGRGWDIAYGVIVRTFIAFLSKGKVRLENTVLKQAKTLKKLLRNNKGKLEDIISLTERSLIMAIKLLMDDDFLAIKSSKTPYLLTQTPLVTMAYYIGSKYLVKDITDYAHLPVKDASGLIGWFILSTYHRRYSSASETRLNEDLQTIASGGNYKDLINNLKKQVGHLNITEETYTGPGKDKNFLLYVALRSKKARDFVSEAKIDATNSTRHHIFPSSRLRGLYSWDKINDVANITLLSTASNINIHNNEPQKYLEKIDQEFLEEHLIPLDKELWRKERFEDFLEERRKLLVKTINSYLRYLGVL